MKQKKKMLSSNLTTFHDLPRENFKCLQLSQRLVLRLDQVCRNVKDFFGCDTVKGKSEQIKIGGPKNEQPKMPQNGLRKKCFQIVPHKMNMARKCFFSFLVHSAPRTFFFGATCLKEGAQFVFPFSSFFSARRIEKGTRTNYPENGKMLTNVEHMKKIMKKMDNNQI